MPPDTTGAKHTFLLGRTCATQGAATSLSADDILLALKRHASCDWGDLEIGDKARNERALARGDRLFSVYTSACGIRFYVVTEWDRSVTTVLLPHEY